MVLLIFFPRRLADLVLQPEIKDLLLGEPSKRFFPRSETRRSMRCVEVTLVNIITRAARAGVQQRPLRNQYTFHEIAGQTDDDDLKKRRRRTKGILDYWSVVLASLGLLTSQRLLTIMSNETKLLQSSRRISL